MSLPGAVDNVAAVESKLVPETPDRLDLGMDGPAPRRQPPLSATVTVVPTSASFDADGGSDSDGGGGGAGAAALSTTTGAAGAAATEGSAGGATPGDAPRPSGRKQRSRVLRNVFASKHVSVTKYSKPVSTTPELRDVNAARSRGVEQGDMLVLAAGAGNLELVTQLLDAGVAADSRLRKCDKDDPCMQTALIKAVRFGKYAVVHLLLQHGADPSLEDARHRTAWYYACFSVTAPFGSHEQLMRILLYHHPTVNSKLIHMASLASPESNVLHTVLDALDRRLLYKDSKGNMKATFSGLHMLDDRSREGQVTWPDGSYTDVGNTAFASMVERLSGRLLTHPAVLALIRLKMQRFATVCMKMETMGFAIWLVCVTAATQMVVLETTASSGTYDLNNYNSSYDQGRAAVEIASCVLSSFFLVLEVADFRGETRKMRREYWAHTVVGVGIYLMPIIAGVLRLAKVDDVLQVQAMAVGIVLAWLRFVHYLQFLPRVGSFFIMVATMLRRDVGWFLLIVATTAPGFACGLALLFSNVPELKEADHLRQYAAGSIASTVTLLNQLSGVGQTWPVGPKATVLGEGLVSVMFLAYVFLIPVLCLNLLIAMLNRTYAKIDAEVAEEYTMRLARYVVKRQRMLPSIAFIDPEVDGREFEVHGMFSEVFLSGHEPDTDVVTQRTHPGLKLDEIIGGALSLAAGNAAPARGKRQQRRISTGPGATKTEEARRRQTLKAQLSSRQLDLAVERARPSRSRATSAHSSPRELLHTHSVMEEPEGDLARACSGPVKLEPAVTDQLNALEVSNAALAQQVTDLQVAVMALTDAVSAATPGAPR